MCIYMSRCVSARVCDCVSQSWAPGLARYSACVSPVQMASRQAWAGARGVLLPSHPATAEGRLDRAARLPCDAAFQTNSSLPEEEKEPKNGIESQFVPSMSLSRCIYNNDLLLNWPEKQTRQWDFILKSSFSFSLTCSYFCPPVFSLHRSIFFLLVSLSFAMSLVLQLLCVCVCVCAVWGARRVWRPTDGQGGSHSVRSGSEPALRLVGLTREAPPTGFWADLDLTQRFCFVTERHSSMISYCFRQLLKTGMSPLCAPDCISWYCSHFKWEHSLLVFMDRKFRCMPEMFMQIWIKIAVQWDAKILLHVVPISCWGSVQACRALKQCSPLTILFNVSYGRKTTAQRQNKGNSPAAIMKTTNNKSMDTHNRQEVLEL